MQRSAQARPKTPAAFPGDGQAIRELFSRFADALSHGDGRSIGEMFTYPALAIANDLSKPITTPQEVEQWFGGAADQYRQRGIAGARAEVRSIHWNTDRIATVEVDWPYLDDQGALRGSESSTYVLHLEPSGVPKLQVIVMEGEQAA